MEKEKICLTKNLKLLITTNVINGILFLFLNTFFIAYFYTLTNYNYKVISVYYIVVYIALGITFWLLGDFVKRKNKLAIYRIGIISYCIYILMIVLLKENILLYYIPLGIFYGFVQGAYWSGCHTLVNQEAHGVYTTKYISLFSIFSKMSKIVFPILFGTSITLTSFDHIAVYILVLSLIQLGTSLFITDINKKSQSKFDMKAYIQFLRQTNTKVKTYYKIIFYEGIVYYLLETLIVIVIMMTFKTSMNLGILTTVFSICTILSVYLFQKYYNRKEPRKLLIVCAAVSIFSIGMLIYDINQISVIVYNFVNSVFFVLLNNYSSIKRYNCIDTEELQTYTVEHQAMTDTFLALSRILGYGVLFITSFSSSIVPFKILLVLVAICMIRYTKLLLKM